MMVDLVLHVDGQVDGRVSSMQWASETMYQFKMQFVKLFCSD